MFVSFRRPYSKIFLGGRKVCTNLAYFQEILLSRFLEKLDIQMLPFAMTHVARSLCAWKCNTFLVNVCCRGDKILGKITDIE